MGAGCEEAEWSIHEVTELGQEVWIESACLEVVKMDEKAFTELLESANEAGQIRRGDTSPSRVFVYNDGNALDVEKNINRAPHPPIKL